MDTYSLLLFENLLENKSLYYFFKSKLKPSTYSTIRASIALPFKIVFTSATTSYHKLKPS